MLAAGNGRAAFLASAVRMKARWYSAGVTKSSPAPGPLRAIVRVRTLGPLQVARDDHTGPAITQPRRLALVAYLALARPRGLHSRDTILALLWPESSTESGRQALRNALHALRRTLGTDGIVTAGQNFVGLDPVYVSCDTWALEAALDAGNVAKALSLWNEPLAGFHVSGAPEFERWIDTERQRLAARVIQGVAGCEIRGPRDLDLLSAARAHFPLHVPLLRRELTERAKRGDLRGAVRAYREYTRELAAIEGGTPALEITSLMAELSRDYGAAEDTAVQRRVIILPFAGADGSDADTLAEAAGALTLGLSRNLEDTPGLRVLPHSSVLAAAGLTSDAEVAAALGANLVVRGRLARIDASVVEARASVVHPGDGRLLHETAVRTTIDRVASLDRELAQRLTPALLADTGPSTPPPPLRPRHDEAHICYVRGTWLFLRAAHPGGRATDLHQARSFFEQALALAPDFGDAVAGLSNYYAVCAARGVLRPFREHFGRAIALSRDALAIDPTLAIPHVHFGVQALYLAVDWSEARAAFERAVALDPRYAEARRFLGIVYHTSGMRDEGLRELKETVRLEPHVPMFYNSLADALMASGSLTDAIDALEQALRLDPDYRAARDRLVRCFERQQDLARAVTTRALAGGGAAADRFGAALAQDGAPGYLAARREELGHLIQALSARVPQDAGENPGDLFNPPELQLALAYAELGDLASARACRVAATRRAPGLDRWFAARPELDGVAPVEG